MIYKCCRRLILLLENAVSIITRDEPLLSSRFLVTVNVDKSSGNVLSLLENCKINSKIFLIS